MGTLAKITAEAIAYCLIVGEITKNNSQVDKLWSILPIVYAWIAAAYADYQKRVPRFIGFPKKQAS
jgi:steroid 5-alpha reductase family enzyme